MTEAGVYFLLATFTLSNAAVLGLMVKISRDIGRINGKLSQHDNILKLCPLCKDRGEEVDYG